MIKFIVFMPILVVGCASQSSDGVEGGEEHTGQARELLWDGWNDNGMSAHTVGMAIAPSTNKGFQWFDNGQYCSGNARFPCSGTSGSYSAFGGAAISAVGIAKNTSHVFAWYSNVTLSEGTSSDFQKYSGIHQFFPPAKPGGGTFPMSQLVEVDCSNNLQWYYYYFDGSVMWRTIGSSEFADLYSTAQVVNAPQALSIVGIAFDNSSPARIWTYYSNGNLNISTSSLNLAQP